MGLQREIEALFRRVVELDLERISRSAEPSYHWSTTPMPSMYTYQNPEDGSVKLVPYDFQVVKLVLNPFALGDTGLKANMEKVRDRRKRRFDRIRPDRPPTEFDTEMGRGRYGAAYHEYIEESQARDPIPILPRKIKLKADNTVDKVELIAIAGVEYVHNSFLANGTEYEKIASHVAETPTENVDQWPEEVEIRKPGGGGSDLYVRADVHYFVKKADGTFDEFNHRLVP